MNLQIEATEEGKRLSDLRLKKTPWQLWGPYLSERQWGTVREDYSAQGLAWEYLSHEDARSRAYRWGEDGLAGICDDKQQLCFAMALWNGKDSILKERLFGLTGHQGNHGEDVKEYYFYLDNVPSHAYMKYLYKYPHKAFPYQDLVITNAHRNRQQFEYELMDTGIFDDDQYFDVFVEYAKADCEDILIRFTIINHAQTAANLILLPNLWFRNTWSWGNTADTPLCRPQINLEEKDTHMHTLKASSNCHLGDYWLYAQQAKKVLFTDNETNQKKIFNIANTTPYVKDSINDCIVSDIFEGINPNNIGTKAALIYDLQFFAGETKVVNLRLCNSKHNDPFGADFAHTFVIRKKEADKFYLQVTPYPLTEDMRNIQRQAFAGLLWNKQCYHFNVEKWLKGDPSYPQPPPERKQGRNKTWLNLDAYDIFSMPDKWEYPWFAAWDLSFHTVTLAMIDPEFAKKQLLLLTREWYMAADGQIPAYEWNFDDANPPVQAWAALRVYQIEQSMYGREDRAFLERIFQKLIINFTWWVNRKDSTGRNIFEGGFLGLDNIGAFDRSLGPPTGGFLGQPDATGWMGMYCLNCLQIALELAIKDHVYEDIATKFFEHFINIADAIDNVSGQMDGLWDKKEGFYYGVLIMADGRRLNLKQDNMTGIIPLFAVATNNLNMVEAFPNYRKRFVWFVENQPEKLKNIADLTKLGVENRILLALTNSKKLTRILNKILDPKQFLSPYGIRSVSKRLEKNPFIINLGGREFKLDYEPAESTTALFGGNSNWRGPIWFPLNFLLIESLQKFHYYFDDQLKVECPVGSGKMLNLWDVSMEISKRLIAIFLKNEQGQRPLYGGIAKFQNDPHWSNYILFHEYFHGDNGAGLGASNQTGWTALVAKIIHQYGKYTLLHTPPNLIESAKIGHV